MFKPKPLTPRGMVGEKKAIKVNGKRERMLDGEQREKRVKEKKRADEKKRKND